MFVGLGTSRQYSYDDRTSILRAYIRILPPGLLRGQVALALADILFKTFQGRVLVASIGYGCVYSMASAAFDSSSDQIQHSIVISMAGSALNGCVTNCVRHVRTPPRRSMGCTSDDHPNRPRFTTAQLPVLVRSRLQCASQAHSLILQQWCSARWPSVALLTANNQPRAAYCCTPGFQHADKDLYCFSGSCTKFTYSCSARQILMSFFSRFSV